MLILSLVCKLHSYIKTLKRRKGLSKIREKITFFIAISDLLGHIVLFCKVQKGGLEDAKRS
jgi:hypothetical protein